MQSHESQLRNGIWSLAIHSAYFAALPSGSTLGQNAKDMAPQIRQTAEGIVLQYSLATGDHPHVEEFLSAFQ